jgi:hypothetical protein
MHHTYTGCLIATILFYTGGCNKPEKPATITAQEQARLDLMDHPKIISKELVTRFHRLGSGLLLETKSGSFEFIVSDDSSNDGRDNCSDIVSPEDVQTDKKFDPSGPPDPYIREESKQPIYLVHEDEGDGPMWILQQPDPSQKTDDGSVYTSFCFIRANN